MRDDDAGWADDRLVALLDLHGELGVPVDVAVIPLELQPELVRVLRARLTHGGLSLHQHGFAHVNHQPEGRPCEFGVSRTRASQLADIAAGKARLEEAFGAGLAPIFTPPWNRCTLATGECLLELGFRVLSRAESAGRLDVPGLEEVPVSIDWFASKKGIRATREELGVELGRRAAREGAVGLMFHHALMDADELGAVRELLALLALHERADVLSMSAIRDSNGPVVPVNRG